MDYSANTAQVRSRRRHILDFPEEIFCRVFEFLEEDRHELLTWHDGTEDIQNCRLVCQKFCDASSRILLRTLYVDMIPSSLSRFEEASRHPIISKGIRVVRVNLHFYEPSISNNFADFVSHCANYLQLQTQGREGAPSRFTETGLKVLKKAKEVAACWHRLAQGEGSNVDERMHLILLRQCYERYQKNYSEQETLHKSGQFLQTVAAGVARLPGARTLCFFDCDTEREDDDNPFLDQEDPLVAIYQAMMRPIDYFTAYEHGFTPKLCGTITELPVAIQRAGVLIERIEIDLTYVENPSDLVPSDEVRRQLPLAMERLTQFAFRCDRWTAEELGDRGLEVLAPCLDTSSLQHLKISMETYDSDDDLAISNVGKLITPPHRQNLSTLILRDVGLHLADLKSFVNILQVSCTWKMDHVFLLSGTWAEVLDTLRGSSRTWIGLSEPRGAEIDEISIADFWRIFDRDERPAISEAELYILKLREENPLKGLNKGKDSYPKLRVFPGSYIEVKYLENGHVTLPQNSQGKPAGRRNVYVFGTDEPDTQELLTRVLEWTADGMGGDGRGKLLTRQDFDDGRCYQINDGSISLERQSRYPNPVSGIPDSMNEQWCETDVMIPEDLLHGSTYTL
ncbi:hypothetical protein S40288_09959 [Stachybotrys chartarum IBT 40288]|nr:hypothetical protein S40288_09959 [Stachybotrys chartarum IBT 40288]